LTIELLLRIFDRHFGSFVRLSDLQDERAVRETRPFPADQAVDEVHKSCPELARYQAIALRWSGED
jgi:hypothetical protein